MTLAITPEYHSNTSYLFDQCNFRSHFIAKETSSETIMWFNHITSLDSTAEIWLRLKLFPLNQQVNFQIDTKKSKFSLIQNVALGQQWITIMHFLYKSHINLYTLYTNQEKNLTEA